MTKSVIIDGVEYVPKVQGLALWIDDVSVSYDREPIYAGSRRSMVSAIVGAEYTAHVSLKNCKYKIDIPRGLFDEIVEEAQKYGNRR